MQGTLLKWTNAMRGWQKRWFVVDEITGVLSYYTSKENKMRGETRRSIRLKNSVILCSRDITFKITVDGATFHFQARDGEERKRWIRALEQTRDNHSMICYGVHS
ncbi:Uncharacterised protein g1960 [Pycnogonum litorale]